MSNESEVRHGKAAYCKVLPGLRCFGAGFVGPQ